MDELYMEDPTVGVLSMQDKLIELGMEVWHPSPSPASAQNVH
jgi:hypothetical protein